MGKAVQIPPQCSVGVVAGKRKDRPLKGLRPSLLNPRTLVRTWGTPSELVWVKEWITRTLLFIARVSAPLANRRFG